MDRVERVAHKAGNYLLDDVIAESNLYSGFPIMQFISLETGLAWRNNGSSSPKLLRYSILSFLYYSLSSFASSSLPRHLSPSSSLYPPSRLIAFLRFIFMAATTIYQLPPNLLTHFIPLFLWRFIL